jgi:hypothetical protein
MRISFSRNLLHGIRVSHSVLRKLGRKISEILFVEIDGPRIRPRKPLLCRACETKDADEAERADRNAITLKSKQLACRLCPTCIQRTTSRPSRSSPTSVTSTERKYKNSKRYDNSEPSFSQLQTADCIQRYLSLCSWTTVALCSQKAVHIIFRGCENLNFFSLLGGGIRFQCVGGRHHINIQQFFCNPISFAICTSTFRKLCNNVSSGM